MSPRLRIAFVGKGGAGKSTISGTFARLLARRDEPVLALDSDPLPGMPYALGVPIDDGPIPEDTVVEGPAGGPRWILEPGLTPADVIERYAAVGPDGVRYLQFGNLWGPMATLQRAQHAWSQVVRDLDPDAWNLVGDLPGGTRQAMSGWGKYADIVCIVVEPTAKSLLAGSRLLNLAQASWAPRDLLIIANRVTDPRDAHRIADRLGSTVTASVPFDAGVLNGDRTATSPLESSPDGPFVAAVDALVDQLMSLQ